jgi:hypothetical protein
MELLTGRAKPNVQLVMGFPTISRSLAETPSIQWIKTDLFGGY